MYPLLRRLLFTLPPELSHHWCLSALARLHQGRVSTRVFGVPVVRPITVMGLDFPNAVGLAAGLDKEGRYIDALGDVGFGFIEVGTLTPRAQPGNPLPRLFRLPKDKALLNRMGFNNGGIEAFLPYAAARRYTGILGVNIGKNKVTPLENALDDYIWGLQQVYPYADYVTINLSSPNTPGLTTLQSAQYLQPLLQGLKNTQKRLHAQTYRYVPLVVKVSPDLQRESVQVMADIFLENGIDGVISTNTTIMRTGLKTTEFSQELGGISGAPLFEQSTKVLTWFHQALGKEIPLIAAGGIFSAKDAQIKRAAGAALVQVYTGFIYEGPTLVRDIAKAL